MFQAIFHITTACNFDCSYCDVIKDSKFVSPETKQDISQFIQANQDQLESFKFFGWEPLLAFSDIQDILEQQKNNNFSMVTNTSLLKDIHGPYLQKNFKILFFSIDSENDFDFIRVQKFIEKYHLEKKVYFNLIISPWKEIDAYKNFCKLYDAGMRWFNILPVYFTQNWTKNDLQHLSAIMKKICQLASTDDTLRLYGFQENNGYDTSLFNNVLFIDIDGSIYYSDIVSTFYGQEIKQDLYLGDIKNTSLEELKKVDFWEKKAIIESLEQKIYSQVSWQQQLHELMDYFSKYMNHGKQK